MINKYIIYNIKLIPEVLSCQSEYQSDDQVSQVHLCHGDHMPPAFGPKTRRQEVDRSSQYQLYIFI